MDCTFLKKNMADYQLKPRIINILDLIDTSLKVFRNIFVNKKNINKYYSVNINSIKNKFLLISNV